MKKILFFTFFTSFIGFGQTGDALFWGGVGLKMKVGKNVSLKYKSQLRFYKNATTLKTYFNELSGDYEVVKNLSLGTSYRYSRKNAETYYRGENRISVNAVYSLKFKETGFRLKTRARYQLAFDRLSVVNNSIYPNIANTFRLKFNLKYKNPDFKRIAPFLGYELFKAIQPLGVKGLDAYRIFAGLNFDLPKKHALGIKYIYEIENGSQQKATHNYLVQYNYTLPNYFKKKKKEE